MTIKSIQATALLLAGALSLLGCTKPTPTEEPIRAVKVITVGLASVQTGAEFAGEVRARVESRLGFRVGGKIVRRQAELGQRVKVGQILAQLDPQDYKLAADAGRAQVAAATTSRDLAAADFKRFKELRDQNFISSAELERREGAFKAAQAQLEQAQAQFSGQGNQAAYTTLVADVAGVVTSVDAEPGQVVAPGTPVVRIAQDGPRDVVFSVPEDRVDADQTRLWCECAGVVGQHHTPRRGARGGGQCRPGDAYLWREGVTRCQRPRDAGHHGGGDAAGAQEQRCASHQAAHQCAGAKRQIVGGVGARLHQHDGQVAAGPSGNGGWQRGGAGQRFAARCRGGVGGCACAGTRPEGLNLQGK
jgi:pyruvate/2-oxoglutarate dehydrogenase complex dihydrolipoamide acyltransferase (E2) component